ncbi:hypothetical protein V2I01_08365 [Micromonospora sp. BRA006-A]|nr:hypothetical protein [Micromonospora sp. BRA006-A]
MVRQQRVDPALAGHLAQRGLATYAEWLWAEHIGSTTVQRRSSRITRTPAVRCGVRRRASRAWRTCSAARSTTGAG